MIRPATTQDIPRISALMKSVPGLWNERWPRDVLERALEASTGLALVYEEAGELLGFVCAHDLGFRGYISALVVAEAARGRGLGAELVREVESRLTARGCTVLIADVWHDAEAFYRRLGWGKPDVTLMRRRLERVAT